MQEEYLIFTIVAVIGIILVSLIFIFINLQKTVVVTVSEKQKGESIKQKVAIETMVELVAKRGTSKNELTTAILEVAKNCPFPKKDKGITPKSAKVYLNFILLVASHKNADAKLIAFMDEELKKVNIEYKREIDAYENEGIQQRGNRI